MVQTPRLTVAQTAARLGVKTETVNAYISRGQLSRERTGQGSTLDPMEVEAFALRQRRMRDRLSESFDSALSETAGAPLMVVQTQIAHIVDSELYYREYPATDLAGKYGFESVAAWLWGAPLEDEACISLSSADDGLLTEISAILPYEATSMDKLAMAVVLMGARDPLRYLSGQDFRLVGAKIISGMMNSLGCRMGASSSSVNDKFSTAASVLEKLSGKRQPDEDDVSALNAALILMTDHDLASSTLTARIAASARATLYGAVSSALGAFDSGLHGKASLEAANLIQRVMSGEDAGQALSASIVSSNRMVPGFGQVLYPRGDERARYLLKLMNEQTPSSKVVLAANRLALVMEERTGLQPNLDLALAALCLRAQMPSECAPAIFALSRSVGWIAHAMDEYDQTPMRLRPRGQYVGP